MKNSVKILIIIFLFAIIVPISIIISYNHDKLKGDVNSSNIKTVSIMGDSISTFMGVSYRGNTLSGGYYPHDPSNPNDIANVNDTWWMKTINELGFKLGIDAAWSGSTVAFDSNNQRDSYFYVDSRVNSLDKNGTPDYIFIFGGTNDMRMYSDDPNLSKIKNFIGQKDSTDTNTLIGAYNTLINKLKTRYPNAKIISILPMQKQSITDTAFSLYHEAFITIFKKNNIPWVDLSTVSQLHIPYGTPAEGFSNPYFIDRVHPNKVGAEVIKNKVVELFNKKVKVTFYRNYNSSDSTTSSETFTFGKFNQKFSAKGWDRTGYTLLGWSTDRNATEKMYNVLSGVGDYWLFTNSSNVTLYGVWSINTYNVNIFSDAGPITFKATYNKEFEVSKPNKTVTTTFDMNNQGATADTSSITKSYTFSGWDITGMDSSKHTYGSNTSTSTSLFGIKETKFKNLRETSGTVNFNPKWNSLTVKLPTITKANYTCVWQTENNGTQSVASGGTWTYTSATERVFKAKCEPNKFNVTLDNQNATTKGTITLYGKYETGVYLDNGYTKKMTTSANPITKPEKKYTVTYNANGGKVSKTNDVSNYTFGGYFTGTSGSGTKMIEETGYIKSADLKNSTSNKTLYAKWTSVSVTLPTPTKEGYTFAGWYTAASGGTKVGNGGASYTPKSKITLYAHWTANSYTIKFDANGGSGTMKNQTIKYGVSTALSANTFKKNGYTFVGWSTTKGGTKKYNNRQSVTSLAKSGTVTLYAVWQVEDSIEIKDTSYMKLSGSNIIVTLKKSKKKLKKTELLDNLTITGTYKVKDKNDKEITSSTSLITTSSKIIVGSTNYNIIIIGDVNKDGEIDTSDLVGVFKKMSKKSNLDSLQLIAADYNQDGEIDTSDLVGILKKMME